MQMCFEEKKTKTSKIVFFVNHVAFFVSHRIKIALKAREEGFEVLIITGLSSSNSMDADAVKVLKKNGFRHIALGFRSASLNLFSEFLAVAKLFRILSDEQPDILHCISPKAIIYGGIVGKFTPVKNIVHSISGMGFARAGSESIFRMWLSWVYLNLLQFSLAGYRSYVIVQNMEDFDDVKKLVGSFLNGLILIPGSGVDLSIFSNISIEDKENIVLLPSRLIRSKGICEFVQAAKIVKNKYPNWRFILAGASDYKSPERIDSSVLKAWVDDGDIEWVGYIPDMTELYKKASIVCLPSYYREGFPKVLMEAAASYCATVTTDNVGCRDAIIPNSTGLIVSIKDAQGLSKALLRLIGNGHMRNQFGLAGRKLAIEKFDVGQVISEHIRIYDSLIKRI